MPTRPINFVDFLEIQGLTLSLRRFSGQDGRWMAKIEESDVKDGPVLIGEYGNGNTPLEAVQNYVSSISEQTLVLHAFSEESRRQFCVPTLFVDPEDF